MRGKLTTPIKKVTENYFAWKILKTSEDLWSHFQTSWYAHLIILHRSVICPPYRRHFYSLLHKKLTIRLYTPFVLRKRNDSATSRTFHRRKSLWWLLIFCCSPSQKRSLIISNRNNGLKTNIYRFYQFQRYGPLRCRTSFMEPHQKWFCGRSSKKVFIQKFCSTASISPLLSCYSCYGSEFLEVDFLNSFS